MISKDTLNKQDISHLNMSRKNWFGFVSFSFAIQLPSSSHGCHCSHHFLSNTENIQLPNILHKKYVLQILICLSFAFPYSKTLLLWGKFNPIYELSEYALYCITEKPNLFHYITAFFNGCKWEPSTLSTCKSF